MKTELFDRLCSVEHLFRAWENVKSKNSAGGVDGENVSSFDSDVQGNLKKLSSELMSS